MLRVSPIGGKVGDVGDLRVETLLKLIAHRTPQSELTLIPECLSAASAGPLDKKPSLRGRVRKLLLDSAIGGRFSQCQKGIK